MQTDIPAKSTLPCDCCGSLAWKFIFRLGGVDLGRCSECGLHYVDQMPSPDERLSELNLGTFRGHQRVLPAELHLEGERYYYETYKRDVQLTKAYAPRGKWLDMGCGTGTLIQIAREMGIDEIEGIELDTDRLALARTVTGKVIHALPVEGLQIESNSIAAVTMINVFSHLTSPTGTLSHLRSLLKPKGVVLLRTSEVGSGALPHHDMSWDLGDHMYFLGERTIEKYAAKLGFRVVHKERVWMPKVLFARERFAVRGRSRVRDLIKFTFLYTPGLFPILRWLMFKRHSGNPVYVSTIVLEAI